ncbi:SDR family NAD(P)-dependent oxidoreductase [Actinomadura verrucosospora]|uniref:Short chain dehydrogenase/reductase family oxidoreductase n=1 Tax=Actinomadura verrucosospora TaxID=46165 RepID=A0A7D3VRU7_ACTVE|nr:SDR family oxidoreductase [Actinomadura verrucosospora]QKG21435.1 short chain dehydrogenase/reductase family oxidoreductase [Actinomadura verrucosospora]
MGRVLIVTGGGSGIGAAVAAAARERGDTVVICGRREDALERVAAATGAEPRVCDVSEPDAVAGLVEGVVAAHGRLDGLVANAGVMRAGAVLDLSAEDWDLTLRTNVTSVFLLAKAALPHLIEAGGAIVAVSSVAALRAPLDGAAYATSKAALTMLTQTIAADYGPRGVRANAVCPGWVRTEMADAEMSAFGAPLGLGREEAYEEVTRLVPQRRPGDPGEAAAAVLWLLGPEASYVNGAVLPVDGGTALLDPGTVPFGFRVRPR